MTQHPLLYRVKNDRAEQAEFLVDFSTSTAFTRVCIKFGVDIVGIGEPLPGTTRHALCEDFEAALAEFAGQETLET